MSQKRAQIRQSQRTDNDVLREENSRLHELLVQAETRIRELRIELDYQQRLGTGAGTGIAGQLHQVVEELHRSQRAALILDNTIDQHLRESRRLVEESADQMADAVVNFVQEYRKYGAPFATYWVSIAAAQLEELLVAVFNQRVGLVAEKDEVDAPWHRLEAMLRLAFQAGAQTHALLLIDKLRAEVNNPYLICFQICWELSNFDRASLESILRLDSSWVKEHVSKGRHVTNEMLFDAINNAWQWQKIKARTSAEAFALQVPGLTADNLYKHYGYLSQIYKLANEAPSEYVTAEPNMLRLDQ